MALKRIDLDLYVYEGTETPLPSTAQYVIQKARIDTHNNITVEIGELVRDYLELTFNDYANTYNVGSVPVTVNSQTRWVKAVVEYFDQSDTPFGYSNPQTFTFVATDGYGYFEDGTNPELSRNALISADNIYIPENTAGKFPIFAEGVGKVIIDSATTQIEDNGHTNQKIQYVTIPQNSTTIQVFDTDDSTLRKTIKVSNICEPKFTFYKLTFVNKFGAFQDLYFFKKSVENTNVTDETYKRNTVANSTATYQTYEGQKQRYNINSNTSLTLNTGFISEDMNQTIEELFFTENVWIRYENKTLPVIPKSKTLQYKTSLNDKLINYTVDFDFAFDRINNVR